MDLSGHSSSESDLESKLKLNISKKIKSSAKKTFK